MLHICKLYSTHISGELNHLPHVLSMSVSMAVINDFSTYYMKDFGMNQAYKLLKLPNNYLIVLICSIGTITEYITASVSDPDPYQESLIWIRVPKKNRDKLAYKSTKIIKI